MMTTVQYETLAKLLEMFLADEWSRVNAVERGPQYLHFAGAKLDEVENTMELAKLRAQQMAAKA